MRPLHKIPAGILLPLAELILGRGNFAPLRWSDQDSVLDLQFFEKKLSKTFTLLPTPLTAKLRTDALRVGQITGESVQKSRTNTCIILPGAFAKAVIFTTEAVGTPPTNANWQRKHSALKNLQNVVK